MLTAGEKSGALDTDTPNAPRKVFMFVFLAMDELRSMGRFGMRKLKVCSYAVFGFWPTALTK